MVCVRWNYQAENRTNEMNSFCFGIGSDAMERVTRNLRPYTTSWWNVCALVRERERNVVSRSQRISLPFRYCCWWWTKRRLFLLLPFKYKCYCIFCSFNCHSSRELLSTTIHEFLVRYIVRSTNIHNRHTHTLRPRITLSTHQTFSLESNQICKHHRQKEMNSISLRVSPAKNISVFFFCIFLPTTLCSQAYLRARTPDDYE